MSKKGKAYLSSSTKAVSWSVIGFSAFVVICLLTGRFFLGGLGAAVSQFFRGMFGLSSYAIFISLLIWSIFNLLGKKINAKALYIVGFLALFAVVVLLVHLFTSTSHIEGNDFLSYLKICYDTATTTTFGGVLAGLLVYPLVNTVGTAFTYVLLFILLAVAVFISADYLYKIANNPQKVQSSKNFLNSDISGDKGLFVADISGSGQPLVSTNTLPPIKKQRSKDERDKSFFELYGGILNGEQPPIATKQSPAPVQSSVVMPTIIQPQQPVEEKQSAHDILYGDIKNKPKNVAIQKGSFDTVYQSSFDNNKTKPNFNTAYTSPIINNVEPKKPTLVLHSTDNTQEQNISEFGRLMREAKQPNIEKEKQPIKESNPYADIRALKAHNETNDLSLPPIINGDRLSEEIRNERKQQQQQHVQQQVQQVQPVQRTYPTLSDSAFLSPSELAERKKVQEVEERRLAQEQEQARLARQRYENTFLRNTEKQEFKQQDFSSSKHAEFDIEPQPFAKAKQAFENEDDDEPFRLPFQTNDESSYFDEKPIQKAKPIDIFTANAPTRQTQLSDVQPENKANSFIFHEKPFNGKTDSGYQLDFIPDTEREKAKRVAPVIRRLTAQYNAPTLDLLDNTPIDNSIFNEDFEANARILEQALSEFRIEANVCNVVTGPTVTRYELQMAPGISVKKVSNIADDIAMRLSAKSSVRIEAPIPGKNLFGIEVPNRKSAKVSLRSVLESQDFIRPNQNGLSFGLGIDIGGQKIVPDLVDMPHLLVAGSTGTGKSVCLNAMIISLMYKYSPQELRFILIDPKRVEFYIFNDSPHMMIKDVVCEPEKAINAFNWLINEMERRYLLFKEMGVKDIVSYNKLINTDITTPLARIVLIVDELSDLMTYNKTEIETRLLRLAQKARAAGIHLVFATQRPSVNIITGTIKANLPCRIALRVISTADSKTILDQGGPEKLIGKGDMLYLTGALPEPLRLQGAYVSTHEVQQVVEYIRQNNPAEFDEDATREIMRTTNAVGSGEDSFDEDMDTYFVEALRAVIEAKQASISMLQRRFSIGYNRAGKLIEDMERKHYITAQEGSKPRQILITKEEFEQLYGG